MELSTFLPVNIIIKNGIFKEENSRPKSGKKGLKNV